MRAITSFNVDVSNQSVTIQYSNGDLFTGRLDLIKLASLIENEAQIENGQLSISNPEREELIETLISMQFSNRAHGSYGLFEVRDYRKNLNSKTDLELNNILMINCF